MRRGDEPDVRDQGDDDAGPRVNEEAGRSADDVAVCPATGPTGLSPTSKPKPVARRLPAPRPLGREQQCPRTIVEECRTR